MIAALSASLLAQTMAVIGAVNGAATEQHYDYYDDNYALLKNTDQIRAAGGLMNESSALPTAEYWVEMGE